MAVICNFSKPSEGELKEIQALEKELGKTLLAFACPERKLAGDLSEDQLKKIQDLEKKLGVVLMTLGYIEKKYTTSESLDYDQKTF